MITRPSKIEITGFWLGVCGVVLFSTKAVFVRYMYQYGVDSLTILMLRYWFSAPVYVIMLIYHLPSRRVSIRYLGLVSMFAIFGYYLASYFDFVGLQYISAGLERIVLFIYPTIVLLILRIVFKTRVTRMQIYAVILAYAGLVIALSTNIRLQGRETLIGVGFVLLCTITYAIYLVGSERLIPLSNPLFFTAFAMLCITVAASVHFMLVNANNSANASHAIAQLFFLERPVYLLGIIIAVVSTILPSFFISMAIHRIGSASVSIIGSVGPFATIMLAYILLGESVYFTQIIGAILVIIAVMLIKRTRKS